jgi:hypothetical protein
MGFINQEQLNERLTKTQEHFDIQANLLPLRPGSFNTSKRLGFEEKVIIGVMGNFNSRSTVGEAFGIEGRHVDSLKKGWSSFRKPEGDEELKARVKEGVQAFKEKIQNLASGRLVRTLECLDDNKIGAVDNPKDLAQIAVSLARVNQTVIDQGNGNNLAVQVNLYKPRTRDEQEYEVIEVKE